MTEFRELGPDTPAGLTLLNEYFDARAASFPGGPQSYLRVFPTPADFVPPRGVFLVATLAATADAPARDVGCGGIRAVAPSPAGAVRFEVKNLYLRPETRGRGLGRALLGELEQRAIGYGADEFVLDTNASQAAAAALYESSGYERIEPYNDNPNATHWYRKRVG